MSDNNSTNQEVNNAKATAVADDPWFDGTPKADDTQQQQTPAPAAGEGENAQEQQTPAPAGGGTQVAGNSNGAANSEIDSRETIKKRVKELLSADTLDMVAIKAEIAKDIKVNDGLMFLYAVTTTPLSIEKLCALRLIDVTEMSKEGTTVAREGFPKTYKHYIGGKLMRQVDVEDNKLIGHLGPIYAHASLGGHLALGFGVRTEGGKDGEAKSVQHTGIFAGIRADHLVNSREFSAAKAAIAANA